MPRLIPAYLLMGTTLVAIVVGFIVSEGSGERYTMIESLHFSFDGSRILVNKLAARDSQTPFKFYKSNISRTVSWLETPSGRCQGIIHQDFKPGNKGPAFRLWWHGRTSVLCNPANDQIAMFAFGGGDLILHVGTEKRTVFPLQQPAYNLACSRAGRWLAASGMNQVTLFDTRSNSITWQVEHNCQAFLEASLVSFSKGESQIAVAGRAGVNIWDAATSEPVSSVIGDRITDINSIEFAPDDTLIVCSDKGVHRYDLGGNLIATISTTRTTLGCISADGKSLADYADGRVIVYDLRTNKQLKVISSDGVTSISLSATGSELAVGDWAGYVTLFDTQTGAKLWSSAPPSRYRWPWLFPAGLLMIWCCLVWRFARPIRTEA